MKIFRIFTKRYWRLRKSIKYYKKQLYNTQDEEIPNHISYLAISNNSDEQRFYKQYVSDFYRNKAKKIKHIQKKIEQLKY